MKTMTINTSLLRTIKYLYLYILICNADLKKQGYLRNSLVLLGVTPLWHSLPAFLNLNGRNNLNRNGVILSSLALSDVAVENKNYGQNENVIETANNSSNESETVLKNENYARSQNAISVRSVELEPENENEIISLNRNYKQNWSIIKFDLTNQCHIINKLDLKCSLNI